MRKHETPLKLLMTYEYVINVESHRYAWVPKILKTAVTCLLDIVKRLQVILRVVAVNGGHDTREDTIYE